QPVGDVGVEAEPDFGELGEEVEGDVEVEPDEDRVPATVAGEPKLVPAAPWGAMPVVFMLPCVLVMFVVALLGVELVQSMSGYKSPGVLTRAIGDLLG